MSKLLNNNEILNYMVDVKGYSEEEVEEWLNSGEIDYIMTSEDWQECEEYNK